VTHRRTAGIQSPTVLAADLGMPAKNSEISARCWSSTSRTKAFYSSYSPVVFRRRLAYNVEQSQFVLDKQFGLSSYWDFLASFCTVVGISLSGGRISDAAS